MDLLNNEIMEEMGVSVILDEELCPQPADNGTPNGSQQNLLLHNVLMPTDANCQSHGLRGHCQTQRPKHKRSTPSKTNRKTTSNSLLSGSLPVLMSGQAENSLDDVPEEFFLFKRRRLHGPTNRCDVFGRLPDELMLHIFYWLPKSTLGRCSQVSKRWKRLAYEKIFWKKMDLSDRSLNPGTLGFVLQRSPGILRLAKTTVHDPVICPNSYFDSSPLGCLCYLDLSMATISPSGLFSLLNCCKNLRKLSLENCVVSDQVCSSLAQNPGLEVLNMSTCRGLTLNGLSSIISACLKLLEWNVAWTQLSTECLDLLSTQITPSIERLNISGCRDTLQDSHIKRLSQRCASLVELDVSDAVSLSSGVVEYITALSKLESLSMSRCYNILPAAFLSLQDCRSLVYLNIFGSYPDSALSTLKAGLLGADVNRFMFSSIARPTVGFRRTSVWGLRIRD